MFISILFIIIVLLKTKNQTNRTDAELQNFSEKQSEMEEEITTLKAKMQMNRNQVTNARSEAEKAQTQAIATSKVIYLCHTKQKQKMNTD